MLTLPDRIADAEERLASAEGDERERLAAQVAGMKAFWEAVQAIVPTPPTLTLDRRLTLHRGGREIRLAFFGRGHTGGDVVVYLPAEKVLVSGDLLAAISGPGVSEHAVARIYELLDGGS
ncbi:MAG TPA: MBL fold metallo-hydrolase [Thermoanaerobaculia bacterium]